MSPIAWYAALVVTGFVLVGVEVFLPGGIIGAIGGFCLLAAAYMGFEAFGQDGGWLAVGGILAGLVVFVPIWIRVSPRTRMGRKLTLTHDEKGFTSPDPALAGLVGKEGVASSALKPGGIALLDGRRVDVVSDTGFIPAGRPVRVVRIEGIRVVVHEAGRT